MDDIFRKEFKTDGELYDASLIRSTQDEALRLYNDIIDWLSRYNAVSIFDIVCLISHFPAPRNWVYAGSHGYDRCDITNFTIYPTATDDGKKWSVYLGSPKKLW